jgi:hypothetical protein
MCTNCDKQGHTASHCWFAATTSEDTQENASENHTVPYCDYCGRNGHLEHSCWGKPGNAVPNRAIKGLQGKIKELRAALMAQSSAIEYRTETFLCAWDVGQENNEYALDVGHKDKECCLTAIGDSLDFTWSLDSLDESQSDVSGMHGSEAGDSVVPVGQCTNRASVLLLNDLNDTLFDIDSSSFVGVFVLSHVENNGEGFATTTNNSDGFVTNDGFVTKATNTNDRKVSFKSFNNNTDALLVH